MKKLLLLAISFHLHATCSLMTSTEDYEAFEAAQKTCHQLEVVLSELQEKRGGSALIQNQFIDLVIKKNSLCLVLTNLFTGYFLQKRLSRSDPLIAKKLFYLHGILCSIGEIKETIDVVKLYNLRTQITSYQYFLQNPAPFKENLYKGKPKRARPRYTYPR